MGSSSSASNTSRGSPAQLGVTTMLSPSCWRRNSSTTASAKRKTTAASSTAPFLPAPSGWPGARQTLQQAPLVLEQMLPHFARMVSAAAVTSYSFLTVVDQELLGPTQALPQTDIVVLPSARSTRQFHNQ